jgi:hypothetical protein
VADEKISAMPAVTTVATGDLATVVAGGVNSKITQQNYINALVSFIMANVNIGAGKIHLNTDGSASFSNGFFKIDASGNLVIEDSLAFTAVELNASGFLSITSGPGGAEPIINLTDTISGNCYIQLNLDPFDSANSVLFGIDPTGCFFQYGSGFNTFEIQANGGGFGNLSAALLALSQGGGASGVPICGTVQLNGLTGVVVPCSYIADDSLVFLTVNMPAGTTGVPVEISADRVGGTSFTVRSSVVGDTGTVAWLVIPNADTLTAL